MIRATYGATAITRVRVGSTSATQLFHGLDPGGTVLIRHALPNALGPVFQVIALNLAYLAGGIILVEVVFNYTGIGSATAEAVVNHDLPVIQALAILLAAVYVVLNLLADLATILVTPKLRTQL